MVTTTQIQDWFGTQFYETNGFVIEEVRPGSVVVHLPEVRAEHRGGGGSNSLNGGLVACLFDGALGAAIASAAAARWPGETSNLRLVTMNLNVCYLSPAFGDRFEAQASVVRVGNSVAFAEAKLLDQEQTVCATATGVWRIFRVSNDR